MAALLNWKLAQQTCGVFILRIEDTDRRREVENGAALIIRALEEVGLHPGEAPAIRVSSLDRAGAYGPYVQSERKPIYHAYARDLVRRGLAYPCFTTEAELAQIRGEQQQRKLALGVYGEWARSRDLPVDAVQERLARGEPFVLRLRSSAVEGDRISFQDRIRGPLSLPANSIDTVLLKSDGLPTYHFAHPIDDTLMGVNLVVRGDEWISATPIHVQLFEALNFALPPIAHIAPVAKLDGGSRRKLSKRHDLEASMDYYHERGYPPASIVEYLLNLLDSRFEEWRSQNPTTPREAFDLSLDNLGRASALFDLAKLSNVSRDVVARMSTPDLLAHVVDWARTHDQELAAVLLADPNYSGEVLHIGRDESPPRKDIIKWSDVRDRYGFFFSYYFEATVPSCYAVLPDLGARETIGILRYFDENLDSMLAMTGREWHAVTKNHARASGYAQTGRDLEQGGPTFKGTFGDFLMTLRVAVTARRQSPDLLAVLRVLGARKSRERIQRAIRHLEVGRPGRDDSDA